MVLAALIMYLILSRIFGAEVRDLLGRQALACAEKRPHSVTRPRPNFNIPSSQ